MMDWLKSKKKAKAEAEAKKREFLSTLKYGANLSEQWKEHQRLEQERRAAYERVTETDLYKEYERLKVEERELELAVLDAIRREHGLPISDRRWHDGHIVVYDSVMVNVCIESPIGYCATYTPEGGNITGTRNCLFCDKEV